MVRCRVVSVLCQSPEKSKGEVEGDRYTVPVLLAGSVGIGGAGLQVLGFPFESMFGIGGGALPMVPPPMRELLPLCGCG